MTFPANIAKFLRTAVFIEHALVTGFKTFNKRDYSVLDD